MSIVCIEGIDASGKATISKNLADRLRAAGIEAESFSFPAYETETGRLVKAIFASKGSSFDGRHDKALVVQAVMSANRYEHFDKLRAAQEDRQRVLVLDRYWLSGLAYGSADGLDPAWLSAVHEALPEADATLYIDVYVDESFKRRPVREDAYEASRTRLEAARDAYIEACANGLATYIDGMRDVHAVAEDVWGTVLRKVPEIADLVRSAADVA